jgi:hypothetical protein
MFRIPLIISIVTYHTSDLKTGCRLAGDGMVGRQVKVYGM